MLRPDGIGAHVLSVDDMSHAGPFPAHGQHEIGGKQMNEDGSPKEELYSYARDSMNQRFALVVGVCNCLSVKATCFVYHILQRLSCHPALKIFDELCCDMASPAMEVR